VVAWWRGGVVAWWRGGTLRVFGATFGICCQILTVRTVHQHSCTNHPSECTTLSRTTPCGAAAPHTTETSTTHTSWRSNKQTNLPSLKTRSHRCPPTSYVKSLIRVSQLRVCDVRSWCRPQAKSCSVGCALLNKRSLEADPLANDFWTLAA
jgi:hypothetical protein